MRKIYAVISEHYIPAYNYMSLGNLDFVFSNRRMAEKQMMDMKNMIISGKWYDKSLMNDTHEVSYFNVEEPDVFGVIISMRVNHSNDTFSIYRLIEKELNQGCFDKLPQRLWLTKNSK